MEREPSPLSTAQRELPAPIGTPADIAADVHTTMALWQRRGLSTKKIWRQLTGRRREHVTTAEIYGFMTRWLERALEGEGDEYMSWLCWHEGTCADPKWRLVARDSGQPLSAVLSVWAMMLETAMSATEPGSIERWNDRVAAAALDLTDADVSAIREAMQGLVLDGERIAAWPKRQFKQAPQQGSLSGAERTKRWRENRRRDDAVTDVTSPVTDVTSRDAIIKDNTEESTSCSNRVCAREAGNFDDWWEAYPHKIAEPKARTAYAAALSRTTPEQLRQGLERYIATKPPDRQWCNPATWLNEDRWRDQPQLLMPIPGGRKDEPARLPDRPPGPLPPISEREIEWAKKHAPDLVPEMLEANRARANAR